MTVAALALAVALLVAPVAARRRLGSPGAAARRSTGRRDRVVRGRRPPRSSVLAPSRRRWRPRSSRRRSHVAPQTLPAGGLDGAEEAAALQAALGVLVGELRVGAHPVVAFETRRRRGRRNRRRRRCGRSPPAPGSAPTWRRIAFGRQCIRRVPQYWERLAACWLLAQTHGLGDRRADARGASATSSSASASTSGVTAGMAGARATAAILAGLPVLGVGLGHLIGADPLRFLLSGGVGGWLPGRSA